jgi:FAD/FMN-containing dehydrogenase
VGSQLLGGDAPDLEREGYVNFLGNEGEERVKAAYGTAKYARLVAPKNQYDPTNLFCLNQNIKPTA